MVKHGRNSVISFSNLFLNLLGKLSFVFLPFRSLLLILRYDLTDGSSRNFSASLCTLYSMIKSKGQKMVYTVGAFIFLGLHRRWRKVVAATALGPKPGLFLNKSRLLNFGISKSDLVFVDTVFHIKLKKLSFHFQKIWKWKLKITIKNYSSLLFDMILCWLGHVHCVRSLIGYSNLHLCDVHGRRAIDLAVIAGNEQVCSLIRL